jgi:hypothetical protein
MKKIRIKAIIFGSLVDIGGSLATGIFMSIAIVVGCAMSPYSLDNMVHTPFFLASNLVLGLAGTFFGGFTAGKFADGYELRHSAVTGLIAILFSLPFLGRINTPWFDITGIAGSIPAAVLGGFFSMKSNRRGGKKAELLL